MRATAFVLLVLLGTGCSGSPGSGSSDGSFADAAASGFAAYLVVNASTGAVEPRADIPDLQTNAIYRTELIVFRRVPGGSAALGIGQNEPYREGDDEERYATRQVGEFFLGVFELTTAQRERMAQGAAGSDGKPAVGVSALDDDSLIDDFRARSHLDVRLPTADEWEYACRAGSEGLFSWGNQTTALAANKYAVTSLAGGADLALVGQRRPNAFGLFDMHGNAWEMTADRQVLEEQVSQGPPAVIETNAYRIICGGSCLDPVLQARSANRWRILEGAGHDLVGMRLALDP